MQPNMAVDALERVSEYLSVLTPVDVFDLSADTLKACDTLLKLVHSASEVRGNAAPLLDCLLVLLTGHCGMPSWPGR